MPFGPGYHVETSDLFRLDGRTIVITGGAGAVGLAVAGAVIESGGHVALLDLLENPEAPENPLREEWHHVLALAATHNKYLEYFRCDVTSETAVALAFAAAAANAPGAPIRGLVACAGISGEAAAQAYPLPAFRRIVDVNVVGALVPAQAFARYCHSRNVAGSAVLVASMSGHVAHAGLPTAAYNASKAAVLQLTRSLAAEWGATHGPRGAPAAIRVNSVSPGYILTPISRAHLERPGNEDRLGRANMLGRLSDVSEYRGPILFLLGEASSFMTAADLRVDGGHCAW